MSETITVAVERQGRGVYYAEGVQAIESDGTYLRLFLDRYFGDTQAVLVFEMRLVRSIERVEPGIIESADTTFYKGRIAA